MFELEVFGPKGIAQIYESDYNKFIEQVFYRVKVSGSWMESPPGTLRIDPGTKTDDNLTIDDLDRWIKLNCVRTKTRDVELWIDTGSAGIRAKLRISRVSF